MKRLPNAGSFPSLVRVRMWTLGIVLSMSSACGTAKEAQSASQPDATAIATSADAADAGSVLACPAVAAANPSPIASCALRGDGSSPLLDDFEDGTLFLPGLEGRRGMWYSFTDGTAGCLNMEVASDAASKALHVYGGGFSGGRDVGFGTNLAWSDAQQAKCTYDLSAYSGIRFRAKGDVNLRIVFESRETTFQSGGGLCPDSNGCFDRQGRSFVLTSEYQEFVVPFCSLGQMGFGPAFGPLNLADATAIDFLIDTTGKFDVSIDDIAFVPRPAGSSQACGLPCPQDELALGIVPQPEVTSIDQQATGVVLRTFGQATKDCGTITRRYLTYVPSSLKGPTDAPVVIVLHGSGADAESMRTFITQARYEALADRDEFVVVYGNAAPGSATVPERPNGGGFRKAVGSDTEVDDVAYLRLVIEDLVSQGVITGSNPVFLAGLSDGGGLVHVAGVNDPGHYLGLALIMPYPGPVPQLPVSAPGATIRRVLLAYSIGDPGLPAGYPSELVPLGPAWAEAIGLQAANVDAPADTLLPDVVNEGQGYTGSLPNALSTRDSRAEEFDYGSDPSGPLCRVLRFDHAGHLWPVPDPPYDGTVIGQFGFRNQDMDMSDVSWDFFRSALTGTGPGRQ